MKDAIRFVLPLAIVCIASAASLSLAYSLTSDIIMDREIEALNSMLKEVLPEADDFKLSSRKIEVWGINVENLYEAKKNSKLIGIAAVVSVSGYQDTIQILVGLDISTKSVSAVKILQQRETPGLGARIEDAEFLNQFVQKSPNAKFDTITGATISSSSVIDAVSTSIKILEEYNAAR